MIECTNSASPAKVLPAMAPARLIARSVDILLGWIERSRQRRHLGGLNNHLLKDIGLSRADIEWEIRKRPWQD